MRLETQDSSMRMTFAKKDLSPNRVMLEGAIDGRVVASSEIVRNFQTGETQTRDLKIGDDGLANGRTGDVATTIGKLFIPPGRGPHPAVVVPAAVSMSTKRPCSPAMVLQLWRWHISGFLLCLYGCIAFRWNILKLHSVGLEHSRKLTPSASAFSAFLAERNSRFFSAQNFRKFMPWWPTRRAASRGLPAGATKPRVKLFRRGLGRARLFRSHRFLCVASCGVRRYLSLCYGNP